MCKQRTQWALLLLAFGLGLLTSLFFSGVFLRVLLGAGALAAGLLLWRR